jgi:hypothetical protein
MEQLYESIDATLVADESKCGLVEIISVHPEIEVSSLAVDSSADFRSRIQG